jgi:hypothetical protein
MGHREPTDLSVIRSRAAPYTLDTPSIQGKEKRDHAQWAWAWFTLSGPTRQTLSYIYVPIQDGQGLRAKGHFRPSAHYLIVYRNNQ